MATGKPQTFRIPLVLLAAANLAALGILLWPGKQAMSLPVGGTAAIDPAVSLLGYMGALYWIGGGIEEPTRKALSGGAMLGFAAGLLLAAQVVLGVRQGGEAGFLRPILVAGAVILWGVAGLRASRQAGSSGTGALAGLWSAMTSGLIACMAVLTELHLAGPAQNSADTWKQYQGLAIGNAATQGLVDALNMATAYLLVGPLAGAAAGLLFGYFGQRRKG